MRSEMCHNVTLISTSRMPPRDSTADVLSLMREIRRRARAEIKERDAVLIQARKQLPAGMLARVARMKIHLAVLRQSIEQLGSIPPGPPTLRGRAGALAIRIIQRALFWLIPPLQAAQRQMLLVLEEQSAITDDLVDALQRMHVKLATVRESQEGRSSTRNA